MHFIDEAKIELKAGDGGRGCVSFRREKYIPRGGPDGGNGGRGGNIYFVGTSNLSTLMDFHYQAHIKAGKGQHGMGKTKHGKSGKDIEVPVPLGTTVYDFDTGDLIVDIVEEGQKELIAKGGLGGRGNATFVTSIKQSPQFAQDGEPGQSFTAKLELKLLADVGLIGFPNAGKSTFLSKVSNAHPKIADYPFTTMSPCLGVVKYKNASPFVIADLPGLIEGAHEGKGMGHKFLKHGERTKVYLHLVSLSPDELESPIERYKSIENELVTYDPDFKNKEKLVLLTKCELLSEDELKEVIKEFKDEGVEVTPISSVTGKNIELIEGKVTELLGIKQEY